jgi:hypothetical protein
MWTRRPKPTSIRVIVVHGIGSQKLGSTASRWADSIVRFGRASGYVPDVRTTDLTSDPAKVTVRLDPPAGSNDAPVEFVIDEAHWAESFAQPSVGRVLRFLATIAPVLSITQSITIWRTKEDLWPNGKPGAQATGHIAAMVAPLALGVLALGLAAPLIAVLLLVLLLGASLPIPSVRQAVGKLLGWLSTSIGDAYLFVADPVNRAAMETRLAKRLTEETSNPTVVLAHSQGAALAYRALQTMAPGDRPTTLITVGSGVGRLHQVGLLQTLPWFLTPLFVVIVTSAATGIALFDWWWTSGLLLLAAVLTVLAWRICAAWLDGKNWWEAQGWKGKWSEWRKPTTKKKGLLASIQKMFWLDIWASFDPVPNGRAARSKGTGAYQLARVPGEQSLVRDHVRYDLDWDHTMPLVLDRLLDPESTQAARYVGVRPSDGDDAERLERIPLTARDWWGLGLRIVPMLAVGVAFFCVDLFGLGQWLRTAPPGFLDSTIDAVFVPLRSVSDFVEAVHWPWAARPQELLGALALLALGLTGSVLTRRVLSFLQRVETTAWLRAGGFRDRNGSGRWPQHLWSWAFFLVTAVAAVVPVVLLVANDRVHWTSEQTVDAYLTAVAEGDVAAVCEVTAHGVLPGCGGKDDDVLRTCGDAREAVAALEEDASTVDGSTVEIIWDPETAPVCDNKDHALLVPTEVGNGDGDARWKVTAVDAPAG